MALEKEIKKEIRKKQKYIKELAECDPCECESCGIMYQPSIKTSKTCCTECTLLAKKTKKTKSRGLGTKVKGLGSKARGSYIIFERDGFRCIYCGQSSVESETELHVDHIVPHSMRGADTAGNLVTACKRCNLEKSASELSKENLERIVSQVQKRNKWSGIDDNQQIKLRGGRKPID